MQRQSSLIFGSITLTYQNAHVKQTCRLILINPISLYHWHSYRVQQCYVMIHTQRCEPMYMYITKCHREQMAEPRSIILANNRHVDKVSLYAKFHHNRQRS